MIYMMLESFFATGLMLVFGVLWLRALRARDSAEKERDRIWDEAHGVRAGERP